MVVPRGVRPKWMPQVQSLSGHEVVYAFPIGAGRDTGRGQPGHGESPRERSGADRSRMDRRGHTLATGDVMRQHSRCCQAVKDSSPINFAPTQIEGK